MTKTTLSICAELAMIRRRLRDPEAIWDAEALDLLARLFEELEGYLMTYDTWVDHVLVRDGH